MNMAVFACLRVTQSIVQLAQNTLDSHNRASESTNQRRMTITSTSAFDSSTSAAVTGHASLHTALLLGGHLNPDCLGDTSFSSFDFTPPASTSTPTTTSVTPSHHTTSASMSTRFDPTLCDSLEPDLASLFAMPSLSGYSHTPHGSSTALTHAADQMVPEGGIDSGEPASPTHSLTDILDSLLADTSLDAMEEQNSGPSAFDTLTLGNSEPKSPWFGTREPKSEPTSPWSGMIIGLSTAKQGNSPLPLPLLRDTLLPATNFPDMPAVPAAPMNTLLDSKLGLLEGCQGFNVPSPSAQSEASSEMSTDSMPSSPSPVPASPTPEATGYFECTTSMTEKPELSYAQLCAMALWSSEGRTCRVEDVYKWIMDSHPYYTTAKTKYWKVRSPCRHVRCLPPSPLSQPYIHERTRRPQWRACG